MITTVYYKKFLCKYLNITQISLSVFMFVFTFLYLVIDSFAAIDFFISDGTPVVIKDKGIVITPPKGWKVSLNYPNITILIQPNFEDKEYTPTIQVSSYNGALYMDDITANNFISVIKERYAKANALIKDYSIREYKSINLNNKQKAYIYYADFKIHDFALMHVHLLLSSASKHFIITYTDLAKYIDPNLGVRSTRFIEAWSTMSSVKLDSVPPSRLQFILFVVIPIISLVLLLIALKFQSLLKRKNYLDQVSKLEKELDDELSLQQEKNINSTYYKKASLATKEELDNWNFYNEDDLSETGDDLDFEEDDSHYKAG